ncbi:sugar phosphate isomerase/epimerase [Christensenellaceae bacterium OttesenSCG-928-L17]|nr:sugar phosphate isomerase/epimerase [Christensenellaceae bacterium OttesenSCG-928-L17]
MNKNISVGVWNYGMGTDRYVSDGYKAYMPFEERVRAISKIAGVRGIEITYPGDVSEENWSSVEPLLKECNLPIVAMGVELVCDAFWKTGSLSSANEAVREAAVNLVVRAMAFAKTIGVPVVSLWLGQDGFDYVFQNDYVQAYRRLVNSLKTCANSNPTIKLGLEYKASEPRMSCLLKNGGMALSVAQATGCKNVGVTVDVGHAFNAGENPAEIMSILLAEERLFHVHVNDNYRIADDDMPVGSVHWPQYFELFYWMERLGYRGWYSLDQYPYRDAPSAACEASVAFMEGAMEFVANNLPEDFVSGTEAVPGEILKQLFAAFFWKGK